MASIAQSKLLKMLYVCFYRRHMKKCIVDYRPEWMKSSLTGKNLEIDIWLPSLDLGIEYQGDQHYFKIKGMPCSLEKITRNDMLKYELFRKKRQYYKPPPSLVLFFPEDITDNKYDTLRIVSKRITEQARPSCAIRCNKMINERYSWYSK